MPEVNPLLNPLPPLRRQLLKWVGSKQRLAPAIIARFPAAFGTYHEPFLGSAGVMATLAPAQGRGSDSFAPLIEIWQALAGDPAQLNAWYAERWQEFYEGEHRGGRAEAYARIRARYNAAPNGADFLFLTRACYGGVVRFRKRDGHMSTPMGAHDPITPPRFALRVAEWRARLAGCRFERLDFAESMARAAPGDLVYCDPPYAHSQSILYGAQGFSLPRLWDSVEACRRRGVKVAVSLDGSRKSGREALGIELPQGLFEREEMLDLGRSMLRRFQIAGQSAEGEGVQDRLLLTW